MELYLLLPSPIHGVMFKHCHSF